MNSNRFRPGPGAASILLVVVVVSMSILGVMALMQAKNEQTLSEKTALFVSLKSDLEAGAQKTLMLLDEILLNAGQNTETGDEYFQYIKEAIPDSVTMEDDFLFWTEGGVNGKTLFLKIRIFPPDSRTRFEWQEHRLISTDDAA